MVVSLLVLQRHPSPFFKYWTRGYGWTFAYVTLDLLGTWLNRPPAYDLVQTFCVCLSVWNFVQTGCQLDGEPLPRRWFWGAIAGILALQALAISHGAPTAVVLAFPTLCTPFGVGWLAIKMLRRTRSSFNRTIPWVGWPLAAMAGWVLTYPIFAGKPYFWVGYWIAGLIDVLTGVGMVVYLLEQAGEELRLKNLKLQELDVMKGQFLSTVSHELRTPLAGIQGYVELLEEGLASIVSREQREFFGQARQSVAQLKGQIDALLDAAQLESGVLALAPEPLDLKRVALSAIETLRPAIASKRLDIELKLPDDLPPGFADHQRTLQVLRNLLTNAVKFTPEQGCISVALQREGEHLALRVSDTGIGIPAERLDEVFKPFVQLDATLTRRYGGTGLGLPIARRLAEAMGGALTLTSELERGTTACFTLPVSAAAVPLLQTASADARLQPAGRALLD